jgi:hypothetical protein
MEGIQEGDVEKAAAAGGAPPAAGDQISVPVPTGCKPEVHLSQQISVPFKQIIQTVQSLPGYM